MSQLDLSVKAQIDQVFAQQQCYALELRKSDYQQRLASLDKFEQIFKASFDRLYQAAASDFSKPESEVDTSEILSVLSELRHVRQNLRRWIKPKSVLPTLPMFGTSSKIITEPKGVTLVVSPWNYPFNLSFCPMIWSIAAGNTVILKPSEMTPAMSAVIADIVKQAFEPRHVSVFEGDADVSSYLTRLPFNHIYFTGSPAVGRLVMAAASSNLASVTLELGGKSPVIVDSSANLSKAAKSICFGKFTNNGQTCIAPDYIYVDEQVRAPLVQALSDAVDSLYGCESSIDENEDYCRVVNQAHYQRIKQLLQGALDDGATLLKGGQTADQDRFIAPTILTDIHVDSEIMKQEIFGPVLPILSYSDIDQAIAHINLNPKPLALYIFSHDNNITQKILRETSAGDSAVNATMIHTVHQNLPFGGVNNSGIGKSSGIWGFKAFSHQRSVVIDRLGFSSIFHPPYTPRVKGLIKRVLRFLS
jgi:aldehyde dehydrogenase (NAD+)